MAVRVRTVAEARERAVRVAAAAGLALALLAAACTASPGAAPSPGARGATSPSAPRAVANSPPSAGARPAPSSTARPSPASSPGARPPAPTIRAPAPTTPAPAASAAAPAAPPARPQGTGAGGCPPTLAAQLASTHGATQLVTVDDASYGSTYATVELWARTGACWAPASGPWTGRVGSAGVSDHHREGDGTTPTGAYGIGPVIYGLAANPGVRYAYHVLVCGDWWDEDPASPSYNTFQHVSCGQQPPFGGASEALWTETVAYQHFAVVDYNTDPAVAGAGSGVFIHDDVGGPTAGCVSLPPADLDLLLRWLDLARSPLIVIGTEAEIRRF
jgi:L,D-peptidoglycan transpeptidase YkuD (ErfK/YbiS/YcfS/YnhG family)